jgi:hypothetical protein
MRKANINIVSIFTVLVVLYGVVMYTDMFPGGKTKVTNIERNITDWDEGAVDRDPIGYLKHKEGNLDKNLIKLSKTIRKIKGSKNRNYVEIEKQKSKLGITNELLNSAKILYQKASLNQSWPITFANKVYDEDEFLPQVELLLGEKSLSENAVLALRDADSKLKENLVKMYNTRQQLMIEKAKIKTTTLLVEAKDATKAATSWINDLEPVYNALNNEVMDLSSFPVRDVNDMMKDLALNKPKSQSALNFLKM